MIDLDAVTVRVNDVLLLAETSAAVAPGEVVALRGPNGAGKTTALRVIAGQLHPTTGRARVAGVTPDLRKPRFRALVAGAIGAAPFARDLTLLEHVTLVAVTWGAPTLVARANAAELLAAFGLAALGDRFPHELSSGQQQLAGLALALTRPAGILLLDEPEQRLDDEHLSAVIAALTRRRDEGTTIVLATHSDRVAAELCARTIRLEQAA